MLDFLIVCYYFVESYYTTIFAKIKNKDLLFYRMKKIFFQLSYTFAVLYTHQTIGIMFPYTLEKGGLLTFRNYKNFVIVKRKTKFDPSNFFLVMFYLDKEQCWVCHCIWVYMYNIVRDMWLCT